MVSDKEARLPFSRAISLFRYDEKTGEIIRKRTGKTVTTKYQGYINITVDRLRYRAHRIAWLLFFGEWPAGQLDHINGARADNRIENLRLATPAQNMANRAPQGGRTIKGISKINRRKPWRAQIRHSGRSIHIGTFSSPEEAGEAYAARARELNGEFARAK